MAYNNILTRILLLMVLLLKFGTKPVVQRSNQKNWIPHYFHKRNGNLVIQRSFTPEHLSGDTYEHMRKTMTYSFKIFDLNL